MLTFKFCVLSSYLKCDFLNQVWNKIVCQGRWKSGCLYKSQGIENLSESPSPVNVKLAGWKKTSVSCYVLLYRFLLSVFLCAILYLLLHPIATFQRVFFLFDFPCIISLYYIKNQLDATLVVFFINNCKITLHVSEAFCAHHQEY